MPDSKTHSELIAALRERTKFRSDDTFAIIDSLEEQLEASQVALAQCVEWVDEHIGWPEDMMEPIRAALQASTPAKERP